MFELLNPSWAWALPAAIGVPLMAHLLSQRGGRLAAFPTVRFVQQASADVAKWLRPRHWLMLLIRILILALIALAFMRPVWRDRSAAAATSEGIAVAIIIDVTASMSRTQGGITLFDRAKQKAVETLSNLDPENDVATVIVMNANPAPILPQPSGAFSILIERIESLAVTNERGDLAAAMSAAIEEATRRIDDDDQAARPVHIEIFSDMQQTHVDDYTRDLPDTRGVTVRCHPIGQAQQANLAIHSPTVAPVRPIVGQTATISVLVSNFGDAPNDATIELAVGERSFKRNIRIGPNGTVSASFPIMPARLGAQIAELKLKSKGETFLLDDATAATFTVDASRPVALITTANANDPKTAAFYVSRALRPETEAAGDNSDDPRKTLRLSGVSLARWTPAQVVAGLNAQLAARPDIIVIVEAGRLDRAALDAIGRYLEAGGAAVWFIDSQEAAAALGDFDPPSVNPRRSPIAPEAWRSGSNLTIASGRFDDPLLSVFEGPSRSSLIGTRFASTLAGKPPTAAELLLRFEDGTPALAATWIGDGRLAVFAADIAPAGSDLVKGPNLVALLHQLVRGLAPGPAADRNPHPGQRPIINLPGAYQAPALIARDPHGKTSTINLLGQDADHTAVQFNDLAELGAYEIAMRDTPDKPLRFVQVDLDTTESDLSQATPEKIAPLENQRIPFMEAAADDEENAVLRSTATELWPWLMLAAIVLIACEPILVALLSGKMMRQRHQVNALSEF